MFSSAELAGLGWQAHFLQQLSLPELETTTPMRLAAIERNRALGLQSLDLAPISLTYPPDLPAGDLAIGDWVLVNPATQRITRRLAPLTELTRRAAGPGAHAQLIAANLDTLFIVTSCNDDFNPARLERYLAIALETGCTPVIVITKADTAEQPQSYQARACAISRRAEAVVLNATDPGAVAALMAWCGPGQTAAVIGSSGVGKSTLINSLTGAAQDTGGIREDDAKGRHVTTARSLHRVPQGGWLIDMPGMREFGLHEAAQGIDLLFDDLSALASACKFHDCQHESEPGCAIVAAIEAGGLEAHRLTRWRKLKREEAYNSASVAETRKRAKEWGREMKSIQRQRKREKDW